MTEQEFRKKRVAILAAVTEAAIQVNRMDSYRASDPEFQDAYAKALEAAHTLHNLLRYSVEIDT